MPQYGIVSSIAAWLDLVSPNIRSRSIARAPFFHSREGIDQADMDESLIRYRVVGSGPRTVVLAADPPVVIEQYDDLVDNLKNYFRVVVFELPGFGYSLPRAGFSFDFIESNNVVAEFLRRLNFGPYLLAFPCVSAYGAIDIANRFPELVGGVVLIQAPSWSEEVKWKHGRDRQGVLSRPVIGQLCLQLLKRRVAPQWFAAAIGKQEMLSQFVTATDKSFVNGACFCLASAFQRYLTDDGPELVPISQPSLVVWGEADKTHRRTDKSSTMSYAPVARDVRFPDAGHFPELEEPAKFAGAITEWARSNQLLT